MAICRVCSNDYDTSFTIDMQSELYGSIPLNVPFIYSHQHAITVGARYSGMVLNRMVSYIAARIVRKRKV